MRRTALTVTITVAYLILAVNVFSQKKIALLTGIGKYQDLRSWKTLSSLNDLYYIKTALLQQGFNANDIYILQEEAATHKGILKALDELSEKSQKGDIVYFHFSGHGQQIQDDNGDEADGYDEALIPFDAKGKFDPVNYSGENHLRDDELGQKLGNIRKKIGSSGSLLVMLDACHSGTATRGNEFSICRGTPVPFQSPGYAPRSTLNLSDRLISQDGFLQDQASNMVVISAASPSQVNFETKDASNNGVGSLSIAFAKSIGELKKGSDYRYLFEKIKAKIQADFPMQVPMIEGNSSQEIFDGRYAEQSEFITITKWITDNTFTINQGKFHGVYFGTTVKIYSLTTNEIVAEGNIELPNNFESLCHSSKFLDRKEAYKIVLDEVNNGKFASSIFIKAPENKPKPSVVLESQIEQLIKRCQYLSISENADFMLDIHPSKNGSQSLSLVEKGDSILWHEELKNGDTLSGDSWTKLLYEIKLSMRIKYLRNLPDGGTLAEGVKVEIIPEIRQDSVNELVFHPLDFFTLKIVNNSPNDLYYTLIDLLPGNEVKVIIPDALSQPVEFMLKSKGEPLVIPKIQVEAGSPPGKELLKILLTRQPIELRNIFNRTKTRGTGNMQSIEEVLNDTFKDEYSLHPTRGDVSNMKVDESGILTVGFTIRK